MTNREPPDNSNNNHNNDRHLNPASRLFRIVKQHRTRIIVGVTIISVGIVSYRGVRFFVTKVIPTEIEKQLSESLGREVDIGEVTSFSVNHLTIENTSIPPTPQDTIAILFESWQSLLVTVRGTVTFFATTYLGLL